MPSNGRDCLELCLEAILPQVDRVFVVLAGGQRTNVSNIVRKGVSVLVEIDKGVNISKWWNAGLEMAADYAPSHKWDVAVLNDDVIVPEGWFDAVSGTMRSMQAAAGCSGTWWNMPELYTHVGPVPGNPNPLRGFAFMVAGEKGVRANEDFRWFWSDNYMDWESRKLGGTVVVPGYHVQHLYPDQQVTAEMQVMIAEDAQKFVDLYGARPW